MVPAVEYGSGRREVWWRLMERGHIVRRVAQRSVGVHGRCMVLHGCMGEFLVLHLIHPGGPGGIW